MAEAVEQHKESEETVSQLRDLAGQGLVVNEYVDPRLAKSSQTLDLEHVVSEQPAKQSTLLWLALGVGICFIVLEALMIFSGRGELITGLFNAGGATRGVPAATETNKSSMPSPSIQKSGSIAPKAPSEIERSSEDKEPLWVVLDDIAFGPTMVKLKGGKFVMGSNRNQSPAINGQLMKLRLLLLPLVKQKLPLTITTVLLKPQDAPFLMTRVGGGANIL